MARHPGVLLGEGQGRLLIVGIKAVRGFSMVEIMVTVVIAGILLGLGLASFRTMIASTHTRAAAESILSGLQTARTEAIRRNAAMRFQLVSSLDAGCTDSSSSMLWVVTQTDQVSQGVIAGHCDAAAYQPSDACELNPSSTTCTDSYWVATKSGATVFTDVSLSAKTAAAGTSASIVTFGPIGQLLPNIGAAARLGYVLVSPSSDTDAKRWAVRINANGGLKLCDPAKAAPDPLAC